MGVLSWYIPGLSELPPGHRPLRFYYLQAENDFPAYIYLLSFFVLSCIQSMAPAGEPGSVVGAIGCWRVAEGGGRSAVVVSVARRRVCPEIQSKGIINRYCLASS